MLKRLLDFLFDFRAADRNREEVETILRAALRESRDDAGFDAKLREVLAAWDNNSGQYRHIWFKEFLEDNRRREDFGAGLRTVAAHVLEDLPRIYGGTKAGAGEKRRGGDSRPSAADR